MNDLPAVLERFLQDKRAMLRRHEASARRIRQYDANNTYQYVINREEVQVSWLEAALASVGAAPSSDAASRGNAAAPVGNSVATSGPLPDRPAGPGRAPVTPDSRPAPEDSVTAVLREDAREARAFVDRWRAAVEAMTNARHRGMLRVILGETLEQERFFEQAAAGRTDLLGRRAEDLGPARGEVLATRWVE